jgi:hypothetical protein
LVELAAHRMAIIDDPSGSEALAWLSRERLRQISKRVGAIAPEDLYRNLSTDSHGDPAPVLRLFDTATEAVQIEPRRTGAAAASLWLYAGFARDQAMLIARLAGIELSGLDVFDAALAVAWSAVGGT